MSEKIAVAKARNRVKMASTTHLNQLLRDLKVISRIEENGRICTTSRNTISIQTDSAWSWITRRLWGDSRERAAETISNVVTAVIEISSHLMENTCIQANPTLEVDTPDEYLKTERDKIIDSLKKVSRELHGATRGISNLSRTYKDDQVMWARLEQLMGDIERHVDKVDQKLAKVKVLVQQEVAAQQQQQTGVPEEPLPAFIGPAPAPSRQTNSGRH